MKIHSVGTDLFPADGIKMENDETNSRRSEFCESARVLLHPLRH